ncbi:nucleotidyltransferase family protein [Dehalococcoidia bacterium]|nr:nucleotidyltransferase family protein [Dehalococcoidia bacterium]
MKKFREIKEIINQRRKELEKKYKVKSIAIFGSYVRGEQIEDSDIDILVEFTKPVSLLHIVSVENYLSDILGIKVDVIPKKNIHEELKEIILSEAIQV